MTWLKNLLGFLPNVSSIQGAALALCLGVAIGGWIAWSLAGDRCEASKVQALARAIEQSQKIAQQDAEILSQRAVKTITIYKTRETAHDTLSQHRHVKPDCTLDADGLRAVRSVYPAIAADPEGATDPVRASESAERWTPDYSIAGADRRSIGMVGLQPASPGAK